MDINTILGWLPQNPLLGPPLPMWMDIHWQPVPEEEALTKAPPEILPLEVPRPLKRYISKVIVKRVRRAGGAFRG